MAMHSIFPFAIAAICSAFLDPTFGSKAHTIDPTLGTRLGKRAHDFLRTCTADTISFDDIVAQFEAFDEDTECAQKILMAAITLRDSSGRDRKQAVRSMAATWNVARYEKVGDK